MEGKGKSEHVNVIGEELVGLLLGRVKILIPELKT